MIGGIIPTESIIPEDEVGGIWPDGTCTICGHKFTEIQLIESPNSHGCKARERTRTLPILVHYLEPLLGQMPDGENLAFALTDVERNLINPIFDNIRSVSLFGRYGANHEEGVDVRNLDRYSEGEFCGSFSSLLFDYFPEHDKALNELRRVIRPGGLFITHISNRRLSEGLEEPKIMSHIEAKGEYFSYLKGNSIPSIIVGKDWFHSAIERSGFEPGILWIRDPVTKEYFSWFLGMRNTP